MKSIDSILLPIKDKVWSTKDLSTAKQIILDQLDTAPRQDQDIKRMRVAVQYQIHTKAKLDYFVSNMLLAKDGLQVIK
jgi:hypothetical protein